MVYGNIFCDPRGSQREGDGAYIMVSHGEVVRGVQRKYVYPENYSAGLPLGVESQPAL